MTEVASGTAPRRAPVVSRVVAEVFAPAPNVAVITVALAVASSSSWAGAVLWGSTAVLFCAAFPLWVLVRGARRGRWQTHHVRGRADRIRPMGIALGSVLAGMFVLVLGGAPQPLVGLVVALIVPLAVCTAITRFWKISMHTEVAGGVVAMAALTFGPMWWLALSLVALVGWARWYTSDHTPAQVLAGAAAGVLLGGGVFALLT